MPEKNFSFKIGKYYKLINLEKGDPINTSFNNKILLCKKVGGFPCDAELTGLPNRCFKQQILKNKIIEVDGPYEFVQEEFEI